MTIVISMAGLSQRFIKDGFTLPKYMLYAKKVTKGQAETVSIGIKKSIISENEPIVIFNIDTFRSGFKFPQKISEWDGYLEVFKGDGDNWSYAKTESENSTKVIQTAEKVQISNYCSTGLYYFKSVKLFNETFESRKPISETSLIKELYVAPLYNWLIQQNKNIHIDLIEKSDVLFCGIPEEYYAYLEQVIED
jgi:dTDP-glucose pyrophosphorylase